MKKLILALVCLLAVSSQAETIIVDANGSTGYDNIQDAIIAADHNDVIIVNPGIYTGDGNRDIDFLGLAITVRSTDPNDPNIVGATVIDCESSGSAFYFHNGEMESSVVAGLTITNGYPAGGIFCYDSSPTITSCTISNNRAGIWLLYGSPTITNCTISNNRLSGIHCDVSSPTISNSTITGNSAPVGGGIRCYKKSSPTITNCIINGNLAALSGGGIYCFHQSSPNIINCTISGNIAESWGGGGIDCSASSPTITNCIFWGNSPQQISGVILVTYSNVQGGWSGDGNIDEDPCFVEPGYWDDGVWVDGDYHLLPDSLCIDAGDNTAVPADTTDLDGDGDTTERVPFDLDGNPRFVDITAISNTGVPDPPDYNEIVDMGAYEFDYIPVEAAMKLTSQTLNCNSKGNWVKAHFVLPEGFWPEDVDVNEPAVAEPMDVESEYIKVLGGDKGLVKLEVAFDREAFCAFCDSITDDSPLDITVVGSLTTGRYFSGTDTIGIKCQR